MNGNKTTKGLNEIIYSLIFFPAIPIVYILFTVPGLLPWSQAELRFLSWCHFFGVLCPWVGSFLYHLFMNLDRNETIYHRLLQLDMLGIWISQSFGKVFFFFLIKSQR